MAWIRNWPYRWIAWLLPGLLSFTSTLLFICNSVKTEGTVTALIPSYGKHHQLRWTPEVSFGEVGAPGVTWKLEPVMGDASGGLITGDTVGVYYDPKDPQDAKLDLFMELWFWPLLALGFGCLFLISGWKGRLFSTGTKEGEGTDEEWWTGEPQMLYRPMGFISIFPPLFFCFMIFVFSLPRITGAPHALSWPSIMVIALFALMVAFSNHSELRIFPKGFTYSLNPFFPLQKAEWGEVEKVSLAKGRKGGNYLVLKVKGDNSSFSINPLLGEDARDRLLTLLSQKSKKADFDEGIGDLLRPEG